MKKAFHRAAPVGVTLFVVGAVFLVATVIGSAQGVNASVQMRSSQGAAATAPASGRLRLRRLKSESSHRVARSLLHSFALFRSKTHLLARAADSVSPLVHQPYALTAQLGLDLGDSEVVQVTPSLAVVTYPGTSGVCMAWPDPDGFAGSGLCTSVAGTEAGALRGSVALSSGGADREVFGLVPDGYSSVTVVDASGHTQEVPVTANMFAADIGTSKDWTLQTHAADGSPETWNGIFPPGS